MVEIEMKVYEENVLVVSELYSFTMGKYTSTPSNTFDLENPLYTEDDFKRYLENELNGVLRVNTQVLIITVHILVFLGL